jgi:release factor glutamine methyltransferase
MMTLQQLLKWGRERLSSAGVAEWSLDAWYLLEYADGCTKNEYFLHPDREVSHAKRQLYEELIEKRSLHIPLQHLTGSQEFMGLSFYVNEHVLIPRQDTEILVEEAGRYLKPGMNILDMCTGSGCILLSVLTLYSGLTGTGVDLSGEALEVAAKNQQNLKLEEKAKLIQSDLFEQVDGSFDRILSNPPYIPTKTVDTLMEEVRDHEPRMALDGLEDGLYFYRKIVEQSPAYLRSAGMLFFEIGYDQASAVTALMEKDFTDVRVVKDLAGLDRVVYGTLRS